MPQSFFPKLIPVGRVLAAAALIGYGVQFFIFANKISALSATWPNWLGGAPYTEYLAGTCLIVTGLAVLSSIRAYQTASALAATLLLWIFCFSLPPVFTSSKNPGPLNNLAEALAVFSAVAFTARSFIPASSLLTNGNRPANAVSKIFAEIGRFMLAIGLIIFGSEHLIYADYVATLVPAWLPWHLFWAEFCGVAQLAAAVGLVSKVKGALASSLAGLMILLFGLLVNGPRAFSSGRNADEWTSLLHTLAWSGAAFILAGLLASDRSQPRLKNAPTI